MVQASPHLIVVLALGSAKVTRAMSVIFVAVAKEGGHTGDGAIGDSGGGITKLSRDNVEDEEVLDLKDTNGM